MNSLNEAHASVRGPRPEKALFVFHPGYEESFSVAQPNHFTPSLLVRQMRADLALLPYWLPLGGWQEGDAIHCPTPVRWEGTTMPIDDTPICSLFPSSDEAYQLVAWGESAELLPLQHLLSQPLRSIEEMKALCHRRNTLAVLEALAALNPQRYSGNATLCQEVATLQELDLLLASSQRRVVKSPFSSSGRGVFFLSNALPQHHYLRASLQGLLQKQGSLLVEPWLNRVADYGLEFYKSASGEVTFMGLSIFETESGQYAGNLITSPCESRELFKQSGGGLPKEALIWDLQKVLASLPVLMYYVGYIGVDTILYKTSSGFHLHPCIEVNIRPTMGHLALSLSERFRPSPGLPPLHYRVRYFKKPGEAAAFVQEAAHENVWRHGLLIRGTLPLCPVDEHTKFVALLTSQF